MTEAITAAGDPSLQDGLTGLGNRRALLAALRERVPSGEGALVLLDLDGFRRDCEGFSRGRIDRLLRNVVERLRAAAGPDAALYRYAVDSFCLLLPGAGRERATGVAESLRVSVEAAPFRLPADAGRPPASLPLTASVAAAAWPQDGRSPGLVVEAAEMALMVAKHTGRNRVAVAGSLDPAALAEIGIFRGLPCPVLVGRVAEQSRLRQMALDVRHVGPALALLTGPPGIGKTRLLRELALWARSERFVVLSATCQEPRAGMPYAPLAEQVEDLVVTDRPVALQAFERLPPEHRAALSVVVHGFPVAGPAPEIPFAEYSRLIFEAFGLLFEELSRTGPLFMVLDEVEYGDEATFEALRAALERRVPFLLAATTDRSLDEFWRLPAADLFRSRPSAAVPLPLPSLTPDEMQQMLGAILPDAEVPSEAAQVLLGLSRGNPLYLEETLRALLLRGRVRPVRGKWTIPALGPGDLPRDLDAAIRAVQEALPSRANSLLARAAVVGPQVDPELLQEVLGQDEMEMLDLIDEARRARLLVTSETGADFLSFPAAYARRIRLASSAPAERREIHGRVGVVQEARHGGDVVHLSGELAFHYGQAGNAERARHFSAIARRRAALLEPPKPEGLRRARLEAVKEPLSPAALEHALAMMRHFAGTLRVGRLYPQWSQVSTSFLAQLKEEFRALLAAAPGLTVASTPGGPTLNGASCDAAVAADFAALIDDRLIESLTVLSSFDPARLDVLLRAFLDPFDRVRAAPDHWDRFLARENLEAMDLVQKAYQAREADIKGTIVRGEKPVPADELPALRDSLRFLKAAVDNLKLYPPGHPLVEETAGQVSRALLGFSDRVPALTLGAAEGELVVNGQPADRKFFGDGGAFVVREIEQRELKSISFGRGLKDDEVRALVSLLSMPAGEPLMASARFLEQFVHVMFGARLYERAQEGVEAVKLVPPPRPIRSEIRAREQLALPYDKFLTDDLVLQFPLLVEVLACGAARPLAEELVDRLGTHFHDTDLKHRRRAYQILAQSLAFASPTTRRVEVSRSAPPLKRRILEDTGPREFRAAADVLTFWIPAAATAGCMKELAELAGPALRMRADSLEANPEIKASAEYVLQMIPASGAYPVLLSSLRKPSLEERQAAVLTLLAVGGPCLDRLVEVLLDEPDLTARRSVALPLALHPAAVAEGLARALTVKTPADRLARVLDVTDLLLSPPLVGHLADLAERGSSEARQEILRAVERWRPEMATGVVRRFLSSGIEGRREKGIELATRLKLGDAAAEVRRILEGARDERLMALCSEYFAAVPNPLAVPLLAEIAGKRPRLFGLVRGYAPETRAAAVRALAKQGTKQAEEAVTQAVSDPKVKELAESPKS